jgi:hypothetical protein
MLDPDPPFRTLLLILLPLLATFIGQRLYLHLVDPNSDLYIAGHNVHHLFVGAVLAVPAAFVIAFVPQASVVRWVALVALGVGSAMVLDQIVFLIATDGSNASYLKPVSLWGAILFVAAAVVVLLVLFLLHVQGP